MQKPDNGLYIVLISVHGLIRGDQLELGRDADTGGQTKYVIELAKALGEYPDVGRVDLITRQIFDSKVDTEYSEPIEALSKYSSIIRLPCGPKRYLRKEVLWPYLDGFIDNILQHVRKVGVIPDIVHGHYADSGYVGANLVQLLGVPLVFTGHSLGRVKRQRLLAKGSKEETIEGQYSLAARIEAEEITLGNTTLVITSTNQEVEEQYNLYDNYQPRRMIVIPPGVDLNRFHPQRRSQIHQAPIHSELDRFFNHPKRPIILAICRPDERKNISTLIKAYGENRALRETANLVVVAGNRDDIAIMDKGAKDVLTNMLALIDKYDLYGHVAYPKHHDPDDIADLFRIAEKSQGVFINPALTEPFGLTLIEAAASGLPLVATEDGGPRDIIGTCKNGLLINPLDSEQIAEALLEVLTDKQRWQKWSKSGEVAAHKYYAWENHIKTYIGTIKKVVGKSRRITDVRTNKKSRLPTIDRMLVCDIDNTLIGDEQGLAQVLETLRQTNGKMGLAVATGRRLESAQKILEKWEVPTPDVFITGVGSEIYYGNSMAEDKQWIQHINYRWDAKLLKNALAVLPGLKLQAASEQRRFKISYLINPKKAPSIREIRSHLRKRDIHTKIIYSHQTYLDLLPLRASKGLAVRHIAIKWGLAPDHILVASDSGNDEEMLKGNTLGVVVGNYSPELKRLKGRPGIFFAEGHFARGIDDGMRHYAFVDDLLHSDDAQNIGINETEKAVLDA